MPHVLQPSDFRIVQAVIHSLLEADWFDRTSENEKACTQLVLVTYGNGGLTIEALHEKCVDIARDLFRKPEPPRFVPLHVAWRGAPS